MMFNRKKKIKDKLAASFGKEKDESFDFESIEKYFRKKDKSNSFHVISDKTCNDLDFQEFFMFMDRTTSKVGQQYYYDTLRTIPKDREKFTIQEYLIKELETNSKLRLEIQYHLNKLVDYKTFYITYLFQDEHIKPPKWFFVMRLLSFTSILSILMMPFNPQLLFVLLGVFIINMGFHYWNKRNLYEYLGPIPQLLKLNEVAKELIKNDLFKVIAKDLPTSIKTIDKVRNRMSFFRLEAKLESDLEMAFWFMLEVIKTLFLLEPLLLFGVLKRLDTKRKEIDNVFSFVGYIDSLISIISLRQSVNNYCFPEINNINKSIVGQDIYHPLIPDCIPNSIITDSKSILLTGSNMSGKTTFIRTIGINSISAMTINTCFASQFKLPVLKLYSAIRISDDLMNDKSYYFEEVLTIKNMIEKSQSNDSNLFLLDEIFKGTNTIERISAGKAVLSVLANKDNIVFVSTHDIELTNMLHDEYDLYHFSEQVKNNTVDFDYKLKKGKSESRNAIMILKINNYPENIIIDALAISKNFDKIFINKNT
jgi:hypothetical protein